MASSSASDWLPKVLFESFLIVISILVALALDEWREQREDDQMVRQALLNFANELVQNRARIEDATPFNQGLLNVLQGNHERNEVSTIDEFVMMVESYSPVVLQSTAWDTALATGSLAKMDYNLVSALSLTYNMQSRYQIATRSGMEEIMNPQTLSAEQMNLAVLNSIRYLRDATSMEVELSAVYDVATTVIKEAIGDSAPGPETAVSAVN